MFLSAEPTPNLTPPPLPLFCCSEVWVMTSSSGRAAMSVEERIRPWRALAARVHALPWPRPRPALTPSVPGRDTAP
jgi:hypothetical protein